MRGNSDENLKVRDKHKVVILAIIAGLFAYTIDAAVDSFIFHDGPFLNVLIFASFGEACIRLYILASFIMFGIFISTLLTKRKQTEEALRESEARYRNLVETAPVVIYALAEDGTITSLNSAFEKITGWSTGGVMGKSFASIIHPDDLPLAIETFQKTLHGETPSPYELRVLSKSGEYMVGEFTSTPHIENGKVIGESGIVRDITERKKAEEALRESEQRFRRLSASTFEAIVIHDQGRIMEANQTFAKMFGFKLSEVNGMQGLDLVAPESRDLVSRNILSGSEKPYEAVCLRKDGSTFPVEICAGSIPYEGSMARVKVIRDITERRIVEEERRRYEERLSALNFYGGKLNAALTLQQVYEMTLDTMNETLGFEHASFLIVEKGNLEIVCQRGYPEPLFVKLPLEGTKKGLTAKAAITSQPVLVSDVRKDKDYVEAIPGIRSELAVPVVAENKVLGVLNVESKEVGAFAGKDAALLQILASHAATAISNVARRGEIEKRSSQMASLMKSSAAMMRPANLHQRLQTIAEAIRDLGWRRVVIRATDESLETTSPENIVTVGLTDEEREFLWKNRQPGHVWRERLGRECERFKIGGFYHLPWSDPWVQERFAKGTVASKLEPEEMVDWNPQDLLYAPLRLAEGSIVGILSIDDPQDGKRPTKEALAPLELFLYEAAVAIENTELLQKVKEYARHLEEKVEERTKLLKETQKRLLRSERFAAIGELAGMVGHDLRNPLTGIAGATYYIKTNSSPNLDKKSKEMLEIIEEDIQRSDKIINDLLEYSKEIKLKFSETTPKSVLKGALSLVQIPQNIQLKNLTRDTPRIRVDAEKISRVFINIIKNAVDAMARGGTLTIRSKKSNDNVEFSFTDTGEGMTKCVLEKIWSPLFTTKAKGMGFGLSICKRIVEAHTGKVSVRSAIAKGSTFTITIPINPETDGGEQVWVNTPESLLSTTTKA
jgi:PAS domain S-box-containing protein